MALGEIARNRFYFLSGTIMTRLASWMTRLIDWAG